MIAARRAAGPGVLAAAAALVLSAPPAPAQSAGFAIPSVTADPGVLTGCLGSGKSVATCLGAMTEDCRAENDLGNLNLEERLCIIEELNAWRRLTDGEESALAQRLALAGKASRDIPGDPAAMARGARRLWQGWATEHCRMERRAAGRDPRRAIYEDACLRDLSAARYDRLRRIGRRLEAR